MAPRLNTAWRKLAEVIEKHDETSKHWLLVIAAIDLALDVRPTRTRRHRILKGGTAAAGGEP